MTLEKSQLIYYYELKAFMVNRSSVTNFQRITHIKIVFFIHINKNAITDASGVKKESYQKEFQRYLEKVLRN